MGDCGNEVRPTMEAARTCRRAHVCVFPSALARTHLLHMLARAETLGFSYDPYDPSMIPL